MRTKTVAAALFVFIASMAVIVTVKNGEYLKKMGAGLVVVSILAAARHERLHRDAQRAQTLSMDSGEPEKEHNTKMDELIAKARRSVFDKKKNAAIAMEHRSESWLYSHLLMAGYGEMFHGFGDYIMLLRPTIVWLASFAGLVL